MVNEKPTWKNTIHNDARNFGHISELSEIAYRLGYPYILWNDRVYKVHADNLGYAWEHDTGLTIKDIK